jgi:hypothetical protein
VAVSAHDYRTIYLELYSPAQAAALDHPITPEDSWTHLTIKAVSLAVPGTLRPVTAPWRTVRYGESSGFEKAAVRE